MSIPVTDPPPDMPVVEGVRHRFPVLPGGLRVHVAEAGDPDAPPIVLQHGWPEHWWAWRDLIGPLAADHHVICPDLRGHGWSDAPGSGYDKEQLATDLLALLDALGHERVRLVGHDWGGFAGFLACLRAPERFEDFVALGISHPFFPKERPDPRRLIPIAYQFVVGAPLLGPTVVGRTGFVKLVFKRSRASGSWRPGEVETYADRWRDPARARATSLVYRTFLTEELPPLLRGAYLDRTLTVPTRLIVGGDDIVFRGNPLDGWQDHATDMQLEWLPGLGHWLMDEAPDLVLQRVRRGATLPT